MAMAEEEEGPYHQGEHCLQVVERVVVRLLLGLGRGRGLRCSLHGGQDVCGGGGVMCGCGCVRGSFGFGFAAVMLGAAWSSAAVTAAAGRNWSDRNDRVHALARPPSIKQARRYESYRRNTCIGRQSRV